MYSVTSEKILSRLFVKLALIWLAFLSVLLPPGFTLGHILLIGSSLFLVRWLCFVKHKESSSAPNCENWVAMLTCGSFLPAVCFHGWRRTPLLQRGPWHSQCQPMPVLCRLSNWQQCQTLPPQPKPTSFAMLLRIVLLVCMRRKGRGSVHLVDASLLCTCSAVTRRPRPVSDNLLSHFALKAILLVAGQWHAQNML